jgi:hypothetical protein
LTDSGVGYQANADFKPFHSMDLMEDNLGYALTNGTNYYYKVTVCDPSANCAVSACSNFTTKATAQDKSFIFKMELPEGYTVDIPVLNKTNYNFSETFGGIEYDVGIKTNTSVTKSMNMTIHCGNMSLGFYGMNVLSPTKIDLSGAFICDTSANLMGMNSSLKKWNTLIDDLHLGGATDYIEIGVPVAYSVDNTLNWTDDEGASGQDVDDYVECSGNTTQTNCKVPVSMGFSAYTVTVPVAAVAAVESSSSSGGGGGASSLSGFTYSVTDAQLVAGYNGELGLNDRFKLTIADELHYVKLVAVTATTVSINVSSVTQQATLALGDSRNFDVNEDDNYDLNVVLNSINETSSKVYLTVKGISGKVSEESAEEAKGDAGVGQAVEDSKESSAWVWIVVAVLVIIGGVVYWRNKK